MDTPPANNGAMPPPNPSANSNRTVMAILAYLGILIIVPFLTDSHKDPFVKFHLKQGLVLIIGWVVIWVIQMVPFVFLFSWILWLALFVLMIIGIVNAASGKETELPIVGSLAHNFNF